MGRSQRGFALVELLVVVTIVGLIGVLVAAVLSQVLLGGGRGRGMLAAANDLQTASHWLSQDLQMAQTTNLVDGAPPVNDLSLQWVDRYQAQDVSYSVSYALVGSDLQRTYNGNTMVVAYNVTSVEFSRQGSLVTFTITSAPEQGETVETQTGKGTLRATG